MEFRVLGPIEVIAAGERLDLGGPKQRTLLALLVANAGKPMSTEALIDGAYGDGAPDGARRSVQTYISTLRSLFGDMIKSVPSGYEFRPVDSWIDAEQFSSQVETARALIDDDPAAAATELRDALALWRGHPFSDIEARGHLDSEITRLNELRLVALESRIDADLAAGRDRELVGELEALTSEHPFRESFHSQHMLALYRSGRQAEALRAYTRMRESLADELGVDPSPELRQLEQRILEQDPMLALAAKSEVRRRAVLVIDLNDEAGAELADPDLRRQALIDIDRVVRAAVADADGVLAAQQGTATYGTFADVRTAVDAASEIGRGAPRANGYPMVRMAVDVGQVEEEPTGAIAGPAVIRAAGLVAVGHSGQVLLSSDAQTELAADRVGGALVRSLGLHPVARLEEPETIHQLVIDGLPTDFPPLRTGGEPPELPTTGAAVPGYELREEIGHGLFGTVYRGYQPSVGREVAIKVINPELANSTGFIRRFAVEARMISRIEHPNVVPLYDFWRGPDAALLVMRLMRGGNLANWLAEHEMTRDTTLRLVDQVGGALATAHDLGIAHGDVHPANVLLNDSGDFLLSDFGIAGNSPSSGDDLTQQLDVAAFASMVTAATDGIGLGDAESEVLRAARRGEYSTAGDMLQTWRNAVGAATESATYTPTRNPYKGLAAFSELDAQDFHGRDAVIEELVSAVDSRQLVAAVGPSGVGKSSVVRAGLLPALRGGAVAGSDQWLIADCTPGAHPFERLASAVMRVASSVPHELEDLLLTDDRGLVKAVDRYLPADAQLLLVVDQFEELFTLTTDEASRDQFLDLLVTSVQDNAGRIRVLATIRADFFDRPLRHGTFGELLRAGTVPISAPTDDEMRAIITEPAGGVGVAFEAGLVERIVGEVHGEAGALPLVEFALTEMFEQRDTDVLPLAAYENSGGVIAALGRRAEAIFVGLDDASQAVARRLFMRLVTPGQDGADTRRRLRRSELDRIGVSVDVLDGVLGAFGEHRLLTFDRDDVTRSATVEVAHEALIREWPRLKGWIDGNRQELVLRGRLGAAVSDWEQANHSDTFLLTGGGLTQHESWTESTELALSDSERELLAASRAAEDERTARRKRIRQLVMSGFAAAAVIALVLAAFAFNARRDADDRRRAAETAEAAAEEQATVAQQERDRAASNAELAEANAAQAERQRLAAEGRALLASIPGIIDDDPQLALLLSVQAAARLGDIPSVTGALHNSIAAEPTVYEVPATRGGISPDGRLLAVITPDPTTVAVHDIDAGAELWSHAFDVDAPNQFEFHVEFANNGTELIAAVGWLPGQSSAFDAPPADIGFHVWDATTGDLKRRMDGGPCGPLGNSLQEYGYVGEISDSYLVAGSISEEWFAENGCRGWAANPEIDIIRFDATTGEKAPIFAGWNSGWWGVEIGVSGDGKFAALGTFMDPDNPSPLVIDGNIQDDGQIKIIDVDTGEVTRRIDLPPARAGVSLSPDASIAVSYGVVGDFQMYDVASGASLYEIPLTETGANPFGWWFSEDGGLFSVQYDDGIVRFYSTADGTLVDALPPISTAPTFHKLTSGNQRAAVFGGGMARVSTLADAESTEVTGFDPCETGAQEAFYPSRGISVQGDLITVMVACHPITQEDGPSQAIYTYSRVTGELLSKHDVWGQRFAAAEGDIAAVQTWRAEPDGSFVVGEVTIVDLRTGTELETLPDLCGWDLLALFTVPAIECVTGPDLGVENTDLVMSPDGDIVAIGSEEWPGRAFAWNRTTGAFAELAPQVRVLAISPDGSRLAGAQPVVLEDRLRGALLLYSTDDFSLLSEQPTVDDPFSRGGIDFSPDGATIVGTTESGVVRFHDANTLEETRLFAPHEVRTRDIEFNNDGSRMATVGLDGFARVWDFETLSLLHEVEVGGLPAAVAFAEDDTQLVVVTRAGGMRIFNLELDSILDVARERIRRGFTDDECRVYFPDGGCPTEADVLSD